jgi:hypothetical protein
MPSGSSSITPVNTPAHLILSAVVLGRDRHRSHWRAIIAGALLPDLPMFGFYLYERLYIGQTESIIWSTLYFDSSWQNFFDLFNSLPLIAAGLAFAVYRQSGPALAFFLSMTLHVAADLPLHGEDAHAHFFPITNWHFVSPVSYWDPAHFGVLFGGLEFLGVLIGSAILIRSGTPWRRVGYATLALYAVFAAFAIRYWYWATL